MQSATMPLPVAALLNANDRLHFHERARLTADLVQHGRLGFGRRLQPVDGRTRVTVTFRFPPDARGRSTQNKRRDPANWAPTAKALIDGLTLAGVWPDDSDAWVVGPDCRIGPETRTPLRAEVTITLEPAPKRAEAPAKKRSEGRSLMCGRYTLRDLVVDGQLVGEVRYFCTLPPHDANNQHQGMTQAGPITW